MNIVLELKADPELLGALVAIKENLEQILAHRGINASDETKIESIAAEKTSVNVKSEEASSKEITLEEVRAVLAAKAQAGMQPQVKALITKYGGEKLTDLESSCYAELLQEAQVL